MPSQEFQEKCHQFSELIAKLQTTHTDPLSSLINRCIEQNITIINDIFSLSIENLKKFQKAKSTNDIICMQAKFTHEFSKKLSVYTQRFLDASLVNVSDHSDWIKAHCDHSTD